MRRQFWLILLVLLIAACNVCAKQRRPISGRHRIPERQRAEPPKSMIEKPNPLWSESFDISAKPCDNFYHFVCGKHKGGYEQLMKASKCMQNSLKNASTIASSAVQKMQQYNKVYQKGEMTKLPMDQIVKEIRSFGACPILNPKWSAHRYNLVRALHSIANLTNQMLLFKIDAQPMTDGSTELMISASNPITLYSEIDAYRNDPKGRKKSEEIIIKLLEMAIDEADLPVRKSYMRRLAHNFMETKIQVLKMIQQAAGTIYYEDNDEDGEYDYVREVGNEDNRMEDEAVRVSQLQELLPIVGTQYFLDSPFVAPKLRSHLLTNPHIYLDNKQLLTDLNALYSQMHIGVLADNLCVEYLLDQMKYLDINLQEYIGLLNDNQGGENLRYESIWMMQERFPLVADYLFISKCTLPTTIQAVQAMVEPIRSAARRMLRESKWLDPESKLHLINKLDLMKSSVGAFEVSLDVRRLDHFYRELQFSSEDSMRDMNRKLQMFETRQELQMIVWPDHIRWFDHMRASEFNAYNMQRYNRIAILGGYIDPSTFDPSMPDAVNFGGIGSTIGHETFHSFDTSGIHYDVTGAKLDLLTTETELEFERRAKCISDQYSAIKDNDTGRFLDGRHTINEDLADCGGVRAAYIAYKTLKGSKQGLVPGFGMYTSDQQFFIGYAETECFGNSAEFKQLVMGDVHSPSEYRVNEVLKNMPEFARAFSCPAKAPMNPEKRCQVW